jgi:Skp family chaperone for outer membrane proteins
MKTGISRVFAIAVSLLLISGCDQLPLLGGNKTVVMDLTAIAKAVGQDTIIDQKLAQASKELDVQLGQIATQLQTKIQEESERIGDSKNEDDLQMLQELTNQARQNLNQNQQLAQQRMQQYQEELAQEFRDRVRPVVAEVAKAKGASSAHLIRPGVFWFDPAVDITDEVIAKLRAMPDPITEDASSPAGDAAPAPVDTPPAAEVSEPAPASEPVTQ